MKLEKVTEDNIEYAVEIQEGLFPNESGRANLEDSLKNGSDYNYYLLYEDAECVGIIGLYSYKEDKDSAWLGWFGIREVFRRRHLGSKALKVFEEMAIAKGYRFARLYTDAKDNDVAISFYKANGYVSEPYENPQDPVCLKIKTLIFSKALTDEPLILWSNRNIHLTEQIAKQKQYNRHPDCKNNDLIEKPVDRSLKEYPKICQLMKTSFPKHEQTPMWMLRLFTLNRNTSFRAFYDGTEFCGLLYTVEDDKHILVLYLVVNEEMRSKGYGTKILEWLKDHTSKTIVLNVEPLKDDVADFSQRLKRIEFYQKNGISTTGYILNDGRADYEVLASDVNSFVPEAYEKMFSRFTFGLYKVKVIKRSPV